MRLKSAIDLLKKLYERARNSKEPTFLTSMETEALGVILQPGAIRGITSDPATQPVQLSVRAAPQLQPIAASDDQISAGTLPCVDFGTSFSKAFASIDHNEEIPELIDLAIGNTASPLTTPSELLIDQGLVYLGMLQGNNSKKRCCHRHS